MKSQPTHLNLEDIARISGFSRSTVSRVINRQPYVNEETRQKILQIIDLYDFQPNPAARALASQRTNTIGVLIPQVVSELFNDPFLALLLQSITATANQHEYHINLWLESSYNSEFGFYQKALQHRLLDGWIIASAAVDKPFIKRLHLRKKPNMLVGKPYPNSLESNFVDVENKTGARLIVKYLLGRGYKRIGMIQGRKGLLASQHRYEGYVEALKQAGHSLDPRLVTPADEYSEATGYRGMQQLLHRGVDAVFAANDVIAVGAMQAIREANLRIPDDIAICGFDDLPFARQQNPPLTTIRQPVHELGALAVEGLITILEGKHTGFYQRELPVELILRGSA